MQFRQLFTDEDAVSPVIGVILMVAITVILAAVIGAFVLGFGGGGPSAPSVTWETSDNSSTASGTIGVTFEHGGGDTIEESGSVLSINSDDFSGSAAGTMSTGDTIVATNSTAISSPSEVALIWSPQDGDSTQELASHTVNL